MRKFMGLCFAIPLAATLVGCGAKEEVKKNEGTIVNVAPTAAVPPGGTAPTPGSGAAPVEGGAANEVRPPPIPAINE